MRKFSIKHGLICAFLLTVLFVLIVPINENHHVSYYGSDHQLNDIKIPLYQADYDLSFFYRTDRDFRVQIINLKSVRPDNTQGSVIAEAFLPADLQEASVRISADEQQNQLMLSFDNEEQVSLVDHVELSAVRPLYRNKLTICLYVAALFLLLGLFLHIGKPSLQLFLPALIICTALSSVLLIPSGILNGHDLPIHFTRLDNLIMAMKAGNFPAQMYFDNMNGFGYAFPTFYPDFLLWPFGLLGVLGMSPIVAYKLLLFTVNLLTFLVMYECTFLLLKEKNTEHAEFFSCVASVLYTFASYRLTDMWCRYALGECFAFLFFPLTLLGIYTIIEGDSRKWYIAALGFTFMLQSHILSTELILVGTVCYTLLHIKNLAEIKRFFHCVLAAVMTIALNAFFLVPFVDHIRYPYNVFLNFEDSLAGYTHPFLELLAFCGSSEKHFVNGTILAMNLGWPIVFSCLITFAMLLFGLLSKKHTESVLLLSRRSVLIHLLLGAFFALLATDAFPWEALTSEGQLLSVLNMIQFPWRFLFFASYYLSMAGAAGICGAVLYMREHKSNMYAYALLAAWSVLCILSVLVFSYRLDKDLVRSIREDNVPIMEPRSTDNLYCMNGVGIGTFFKRGNTIEIEDPYAEDLLTFSDYSVGGGKLSFRYRSELSSEITLHLPLVYDPNYIALINNERVTIACDDHSRNSIIVPPQSSGDVFVYYKPRKIYPLGYALSLISLIVLCYFVRRNRNISKSLPSRETVSTNVRPS